MHRGRPLLGPSSCAYQSLRHWKDQEDPTDQDRVHDEGILEQASIYCDF